MYHWFIIFAGVNGLLVTLLAINVSLSRVKYRVANGDGGQQNMKKAIRAHGNAVEHISIFALLVLALCMLKLPSMLLAFFVIAFSAMRILHAYSMLKSRFNHRRLAAGGVYLLELAAAVVALVFAVLTI